MNDGIDKETRHIVSLYVSGWSENQIALRFHRSRRYIRKRLVDSNVHIRNQSEAEALKWSQMSPDQRKKQLEAAHKATLGRKVSWLAKCKHAKTIEKRPSNFSQNELILQDMLLRRGITTIHQKAIGAYNCDLAAEPVAVEVWGGHWHFFGKHKAILKKRLRYILNRGWFVYIVPVTKSFPLTESVADDLAAYIKRIRRNKPSVCEYRVVWRAPDYTVRGSLDNLNLPIIPPFTHTRDTATGRYKRIPR